MGLDEEGFLEEEIIEITCLPRGSMRAKCHRQRHEDGDTYVAS